MFFSANLAHPITPAYFESLNYPNYMFGVAFSLMSLGIFLVSPMWSKLAEKHGYIKVMSLGLAVYGIAQLWFGLGRTVPSTLLARLLAGIFTAAMQVGGLLYISNFFEENKKGERIALAMALQISIGAAGFFLGGYLGNINIMIPLYIQPILCVLTAIFIFVVFEDKGTESNKKIELSEINPFKAFSEVIKIMTPTIVVFYGVVALVSFAVTCYDTSFNYYIKNTLNLPSIYNGAIKGSIAVIGLLLNFSLSRYIAHKYRPYNVNIVYYGISILFLLILIFTQNFVLFLGAAILIYIMDSITKPIQQIMGTENSIIYGGYNSINALGMVTGSLSAGYLYTVGPKLPFYASLIMFTLSFMLALINRKQRIKTV